MGLWIYRYRSILSPHSIYMYVCTVGGDDNGDFDNGNFCGDFGLTTIADGASASRDPLVAGVGLRR